MKILVVDDDPGIRHVVTIALERSGFTVVQAADGASALNHAMRENPVLIVLDIGMPEMDGLEFCRHLRARSAVPILFLTARDEEIDRVLGFELGADDYVTKPFSPRELVARIKAILKRASGGTVSPIIRHGPIVVEEMTHVCRVSEREVALTAKEFALLTALMRAPDRVHLRARLIAGVWGAGSQVSERTLDTHLRNLRQKLDKAGAADAIQIVHGVGVRLSADPA